MEDRAKKFKYQQGQIAQLTKDLQAAQDQVKDQGDAVSQAKDAIAAQRDALLQEVGKRKLVEDQFKTLQSTLTTIETQADSIKQEMVGWQKDYVAVLADVEKKVDLSRWDIKNFQDNLTALNIPELRDSIASLRAQVELLNHPPASVSTLAPVAAASTGPGLAPTSDTDAQKAIHEIDYHY